MPPSKTPLLIALLLLSTSALGQTALPSAAELAAIREPPPRSARGK